MQVDAMILPYSVHSKYYLPGTKSYAYDSTYRRRRTSKISKKALLGSITALYLHIY
jgi:hypothetical protein